MSAPAEVAADKATMERLKKGMRMVTVPFPHLSGLAAAVRIDLDDRVPTMGIFASGRMVANRAFTARLNNNDLLFVLAHELLHLALRTHERAVGSSRLEFNYAHDYIINDMLRHALNLTNIPAGGLDMHGARERSAEEIVLDMRKASHAMETRTQVFEGSASTVEQVMDGARQNPGTGQGDVLDSKQEREMFPGSAEEQAAREKEIREMAARGVALGKALAAMRGRGNQPGNISQPVRALRGIYRTPWQIALQRWLEGSAPAERTFQRASRRGADRTDLVMPGRQRYAMMLNVILDTSASMSEEVAGALGAIADFCEATGVEEIRVVQCDTVVTSDEVLSPEELVEYEIKGYGGSDLTAAMKRLGEDPRVTAAIIITDGDISYPADPTPYSVLWAIPGESTNFDPPYGRVITMNRGVPT